VITKKFTKLLLTLVILTLSCHKVTKVQMIDPLLSAPEYRKTLKDWTRDTEHYYFSDVEFFITASYKSLPLRLAYLKEYTKKFKISKEEQQTKYDQEMKDYNNCNDFFVTVFSSKNDINDLRDKEKWRLFLSEGTYSGRIVPESINKVETDSILQFFYPYVTPWTWNFNVRFSRILNDAQTTKDSPIDFSTLSLMFATVGGEHSFTWGVTKEEEK
jgi:hypothetical protein